MFRKMGTKLLFILIVMLFLASCTQSAADENANVREKDGMEMVYVPSGSFMMGSSDELLDWVLNQDWCTSCKKYMVESEQPQHEVYLDAYWIDKYEVTNAQYALCVADGVCTESERLKSPTRSDYYSNPEYADFPVTGLVWHEARDYCEWAGGSLPTEAQWEKAAQGTDGRSFPWGDEAPTCKLANFKFDGESCVGDTAPVGSYPKGASPYGALDMAGNAWEWVLDGPGGNVYENGPFVNPVGIGGSDNHMIRGGSWEYPEVRMRTQYRTSVDQHWGLNSMGLRCAMAP